MTKEEIIKRMEIAEGIYGTMYGTSSKAENYTFIDKYDMKYWKNEGYCFVWGYPGPDYNLYTFADYGITWSFDEEDMKNQGYKKYT